MLEKLDKINLEQNLSELSKTFGQNNNHISQLYDSTIESVKPLFSSSTTGQLYDNVSYFKVVSNLNLEEYNERVFDELLSNIYFFLCTKH